MDVLLELLGRTNELMIFFRNGVYILEVYIYYFAVLAYHTPHVHLSEFGDTKIMHGCSTCSNWKLCKVLSWMEHKNSFMIIYCSLLLVALRITYCD
jgi:hypothetical protein